MGAFVVVSVLGSGGMANVYEANDTRTGTAVALKVPHAHGGSTGAVRLQREARALRNIRHRAVCTVFEEGLANGGPYLAMELVRGVLLAERLQQGPFDVEEAVTITCAVLEGLDAAHGAGVLHRDLKPGNVMQAESNVKLLDFGLARNVLGAEDDSSITAVGSAMGTPAYMAPEQIQGAADLDVRCDVYGSGALLFHLVTGRPPYLGRGRDLLLRAWRGERPRLDELAPNSPPALVEIVERAMATERTERFTSAADLRAALCSVAVR